MEKWDIMNAGGVATGKTTVRGQNTLKQGEYHLVVHIWVISDEGKLLIQRRSDNKKLMPGEWAAIGGSAISGETSFCAAQRELLEEMGIPFVARRSKKMCRIKKRNSFVDVWFTLSNVHLDDLVLQSSEVSCAKWVTKNELEDMIENSEFHNYGKEYFTMIFRYAEEFLYEYGSKR